MVIKKNILQFTPTLMKEGYEKVTFQKINKSQVIKTLCISDS